MVADRVPLCYNVARVHAKGVMIMDRFVPKEKMSKKALRELNRRRRVTWDVPPVTKTVESKKIYSRKRKTHDRYDDYGMGFLFGASCRRAAQDQNASYPGR